MSGRCPLSHRSQTSEQSELLEPLKFQEQTVIHSSTTSVPPRSKKQNKTKVLPGKKTKKQKCFQGAKKIKLLPGRNAPSFPNHLQCLISVNPKCIISIAESTGAKGALSIAPHQMYYGEGGFGNDYRCDDF
jgi:hypothetical protein